MCNAEASSKRCGAPLEGEDMLYKPFVDHSTDGFFLIDETGRIIEWNHRAEEIFGLPREKILGAYAWDMQLEMVPKSLQTLEQRKWFQETILSMLEQGKSPLFDISTEHTHQFPDGRYGTLQQTTFLVPSNHGNRVGVITRDITSMRNEQAAREKAVHTTEILLSLQELLNTFINLPDFSKRLCKKMAEFFHLPVAVMFFFNPATEEFELSNTYGLDGKNIEVSSISRSEIIAFHQQLGEMIQIIPRADLLYSPSMSFIHRIHAVSMAALLLGRDQVPIGWLCLFSVGQERVFELDEVRLLRILNNQIALALSNQMLFEKLFTGKERLQQLSQKLMDAHEFEKRHLAKELHDEVGQMLTHVKLNLERIDWNAAEHSSQLVKNALEEIQCLMGRIRGISLDLRPTILDELGLIPALFWYFDRFQTTTGIQINFRHPQAVPRFSSDVETTIYRVVQEGLNNVAKHAQVSAAVVFLWFDERMIGLQIEDQGIGFHPEIEFERFQNGGLSGMRERALLCGGSFSIESAPGRGTCVTLELPRYDDTGAEGKCP